MSVSDAITTELADMFADEVTVEAYASEDGFGNATYASGVTRSCRLSSKGGQQRFSQRTGQEYATKGKIVFAGAYGVKAKDRITLPADTAFDPNVVLVEEAIPVRDENGPHHDKVFF